MNTSFHSNGKLLLTGEYVILDGAKGLALPTKFGQSMEVYEGKNNTLSWKSINEQGKTWFEENFLIAANGKIKRSKENPVSERLEQILSVANSMNPDLLSGKIGFEITSTLDFPQNWGLGSSSTLINNIAAWFEIDAYKLLEATFGGSGYDLACAKINQPLAYRLQEEKRLVTKENFNPPFQDQLFFVHLNQKKNSRDAIAQYKNQPKDELSEAIKAITQITDTVIDCEDIISFQKLLNEHEKIISSLIKIPPIKAQLFSDYPNTIKSLGGWGGDFIMAIGEEEDKNYFRKKGFQTVVAYSEMTL